MVKIEPLRPKNNHGIRILSWLVAVFLLGYGLFSVFTLNHNLGNYLPILIALGILVTPYLLKSDEGDSRVMRALRKAMLAILLLYVLSLIIALGMIWLGGKGNADTKADAIIILGAGLRGDRVSATLALRLDRALEYAHEHPSSIVVVSGGQGPDEWVTEASAMKKYLVARGVAEERVFEEGKSTSTKENFMFSKRILDEIFRDRPYTLVYVTNQFHSFRAGKYAGQVGVDATALPSENYPYTVLSNYMREHLAILWYYIYERWQFKM